MLNKNMAIAIPNKINLIILSQQRDPILQRNALGNISFLKKSKSFCNDFLQDNIRQNQSGNVAKGQLWVV